MISCNSQASLHNPERVDPSRSANLAIRTSLNSIDDQHIKSLSIVGPINTSVAVVVTRAPPADSHPSPTDDEPADSPPSTIPSPRTALLPTGGEVGVIPVAHSMQPPLEPLTVQPSLPVMDEAVEGEEADEGKEAIENEEASTRAVEVAQTKPQAQASTSAVNVVPLDSSNPEATINAPQAVWRYLTRWPRGDKDPHPVFDNTDLHDFRMMHNNQDDERRRAELAKVVPRHVNVSFVQLCIR
jgi:hypothetical protein